MSARLQAFFQKAKQDPNYQKKQRQAEVAADLRILIAESGRSFKDIANSIGTSGAALSQKLGGEVNLTIDSIAAISNAIGYDFDIVFREKNAPRARQLWESISEANGIIYEANELLEKSRQLHAENTALKKTWSDICRAQFRRGQKTLRISEYHLENLPANGFFPGHLQAVNE